jgi:hypothetical protein
MSTLPHDASHATEVVHQTPVIPPPYEQLVEEAVREFESDAELLRIPRPPTAELLDVCRKVAAFTSELFPDGMAIKVKNDPEIADDLYFVFRVVAVGSIDELVSKDNEWHRRLRPAVGARAEFFCLAISVK